MNALEQIGAALRFQHEQERKSWRKIAETEKFQGIPAATLCAISKGREPKDPVHRLILGLPAMELAPVCLKCGQVHVTKRCTNRAPRAKPVQREHNEQAALIQLIGYFETAYPDLKWLFAIPNGGHRNKVVAARLKAEGVKAGVLDLMLPVPRGRFHGLFLEMKSGDNKPSKEQERWIEYLSGQGYFTTVEYSSQAAFDQLTGYLDLPDLARLSG